MGDATDGPRVETYRLADDGTVPNNALPLVLYRGALKADGDRAAAGMLDATIVGQKREAGTESSAASAPCVLRHAPQLRLGAAQDEAEVVDGIQENPSS